MLTTLSRAAWVGGLVGAVIWGFRRPRMGLVVLLVALLCHLLCQQAPGQAERARDYMPWHKKTSPAHMEGMTANNTITTMSDALATDRPTLTVKEVASLLGVDVRTVYRAIDEDQLPSLQVGTKRLSRA